MYRVLVLTAVVLSSSVFAATGTRAGCVDLGPPPPGEVTRVAARQAPLEAWSETASRALLEELIEANRRTSTASLPEPAPVEAADARYPIKGCFGAAR